MNDIEQIAKIKQELEKVKKDMPDMMMLYEMIQSCGFSVDDIIRAVALAGNVKKMTKWGKVSILLQDGDIVSVLQEQQFITSRELERTFEMNRKKALKQTETT